jgi:hypothetical protein
LGDLEEGSVKDLDRDSIALKSDGVLVKIVSHIVVEENGSSQDHILPDIFRHRLEAIAAASIGKHEQIVLRTDEDLDSDEHDGKLGPISIARAWTSDPRWPTGALFEVVIDHIVEDSLADHEVAGR